MSSRPWIARATVWAASAVVAVASGLPAVWWEPLHLDEAIMLRFATRAPREILTDVFVERGGAPLQFFVEHVTLQWPGGLAGLRLPSLCFFALAVVFSGLLALELFGEREALIVPPLLATAPLAVELGTFARMYALFLWLAITVGWLALVAGRSGRRRDWLLTGALAGGLVYVHPIAPLACAAALAGPFLVDSRPLRVVLGRAWPGLVLGCVVAAPYLYALAVLSSRYGVGEGGRLDATYGRSVPEEAIRALTPGGTAGAVLVAGLAGLGLVHLGRRAWGRAIAASLWVAVPILFFTAVPAETRFFARYVIFALPALLGLVAGGCLALAARSRAAATVALGCVIALGLGDGARRLDRLRDLRLQGLPELANGTVLFSSTGSPRADRPPELLDDLVALESGRGERLEELPSVDPRFDAHVVANGAANVRTFVSRGGDAGALWIFEGEPFRVRLAAKRLRAVPEVRAQRVGARLLAVETRQAHAHERLVELAIAVRAAWGLRTPSDRWPRAIVAADHAGLRSPAPTQADSMEPSR